MAGVSSSNLVCRLLLEKRTWIWIVFFRLQTRRIKKEIDELASSIKEIDNNLGKALSFDEFQKEFDFDKQDPKEEKLEVKVIQDKIEYSEYSRKKELAEIIEELSL